MDSSDTDAYTPIAQPATHRRARLQQHLGLSTHLTRSRYPSNTLASPATVLPQYTPKIAFPSASDAPPTYTDVDAEDGGDREDEGDEEGDDKALPLPMTNPLSRRRVLTNTSTGARNIGVPRRRSSSLQGKHRSSTSISTVSESNSNDLYLDSLLARSVHALELSNALLQSTISTKTSLSSVLHSEDVLDRSLARQQRNLSATLREGQEMQAAWMGEMRGVVEGVEDLFDDGQQYPHSTRDEYWPRTTTMPGSPPSTSSSPLSSQSPRRPSAHALLSAHSRTTSSSSGGGGLHRGNRPRSPPPRALTQYVSVAHSRGTTTETTADGDSIYLPSTTGLRAAAHVEEFGAATPMQAGFGYADQNSGSGRGTYAQNSRR
jgi:hypothetical protein